MSITEEEYRARKLAALIKIETAAGKFHDIINKPAGEFIQTESGPVPSYATLASSASALSGEINALLGNLTETLNDLPSTEETP